MDFKKLKKVIEKDVRLKLEASAGVTLFSNGSEKFENWLQVELADALAREEGTRKKIIPEALVKIGGSEYQVDLLMENEWAIEVKVLNEEDKKKASSETIESLKNDILKLREIKKGYSEKNIAMNTAVAYFVVPAGYENNYAIPEKILSGAFGTDDSAFAEEKRTFFFNDNSKKGAIYVREV